MPKCDSPKIFLKLPFLRLIPSVNIGNKTGNEVLDDLPRGIDAKMIRAALAPLFIGKHRAISAAALIRFAHFAKELTVREMLISARFAAATQKLRFL